MKIDALISNPKSWPKQVSSDTVCEAVERRNNSLDNPGFCLACGLEANDCEPDARNYECDGCGEKQVFGAEELLMYIA